MNSNEIVFWAMKSGDLLPAWMLTCHACSDAPAAEWHHWSYEPEHALDVVPLCNRCHSWVHAAKLPDPTAGAYWCRYCHGPVECGHPRGMSRMDIRRLEAE